MAMTIWKYSLTIVTTPQTLSIPSGAKIIFVMFDTKNSTPYLWVELDAAQVSVPRTFQLFQDNMVLPLEEPVPGDKRIRGTLDPDLFTATPTNTTIYLGTIYNKDAVLMWHVYELWAKPPVE